MALGRSHPSRMAPRKRRRACTPPAEWALPADLVLEIVAHSDATTLFRCAAACKLLRREILRPAFIGRVCQEPDGAVPSTLLGLLGGAGPADDTFSIVHPATPAAASFAETRLEPFLSRRAGRLLDEYMPVASRGGLFLLQRRDGEGEGEGANSPRRLRSHRLSDLCVYDPMSGERTFLPLPPDIALGPWDDSYSYALLTAADGIPGCSSFLLLAADMGELGLEWRFGVQSVSPDAGGKWAPLISVDNPVWPWRRSAFVERPDAVVVLAGVVHWLVHVGHYVITYDMAAAAAGWIELPEITEPEFCRKHLGSLPDGRLCLFVADGLRVSMWALRGVRWERCAELDLLPSVRSPWEIHRADLRLTELDQRSRVLLISLADFRDSPVCGFTLGRFLVDMETSEIGWTGLTLGVPYEVDLPSRLSAMKTF
ncbi:unnamed protein product [Urochloa humidicola]